VSDFDSVVNLATNRGFVFNASSIYGGLRSSYDYGPLGTLLKKHIADSWWKSSITTRANVYPIDTAVIQSTDVWRASGHISEFSDPLIECNYCNKRYKEDAMEKVVCETEDCKGKDPNFSSSKEFNLMFQTYMGPVKEEGNEVYLRPETAQGIYINFSNILRATRSKIPFGVANIGKSFRNEITPGQFIFRTREFEQMELQFFCREEEEEEWFEYWVNERFNWYLSLGIKKENLRLREHESKELAHYAKRTTDIEYLYPWGWGELEGVSNRGSFDLKAHTESSGEELSYFDEETGSKIIPSVIEPAGGLTRTFFAVMLDSYQEEQIDDDTRVVLKLDKSLAPIHIAILPLSKKDPLIEVAEEINKSLIATYSTEIDLTQSIGKRYRRQDEIGTPYCVTVDFESLEDNMVTIRDRDTMDQERVLISELREVLERKFN
tara:strand:- start:1550 stop:2857 length:1308 start_codon:yes stop_codon:yes gene_type:complete